MGGPCGQTAYSILLLKINTNPSQQQTSYTGLGTFSEYATKVQWGIPSSNTYHITAFESFTVSPGRQDIHTQ